MWFRRLLPVLLGILAGLFDATVSVWLPGSAAAVRFALPLVILFAAFSSPARAFLAAAAAGVVLDAFLPTFGLVMLRLLAVVGAVVGASRIYLTNRALVGSLALGAVGFVTDRVMLWAILGAQHFFGRAVIPEYRPPFVAEGMWVLLCLAAAFLLFAAFARRFVPFASQSR